MRRVLAITAVGIRIGLRRRFLIIAMLLAVPMTFMFGVLFYVAADKGMEFVRNAGLFLAPQEWKELLGPDYTIYTIWGALLNRHLFYQMMWVLIVIPWVGPSLLADDFESRAMTIYFSKPITRLEYLFGKWMVLGFFVACVTAIPSTLLYVTSILLCRDLDIFWHTMWMVPGAWFVSLLVAAVGGLMMMAFSAAGRSRRFAALGWLITVMGSWGVVSAIEDAPRAETPMWANVLNLVRDVDVVGKSMFGVAQSSEASVLWSLGVLLAVGAVSLAYLWRRIHTVEGLR